MSLLAPRSIQQRLSQWLALQTLLGLTALCAGIYGVTAWQTHLRQQGELDSRLDLAAHVLREATPGADLTLAQHKLGDFFARHDELAIRVATPRGPVYETMARPGAHWIWRDRQEGGYHIRVGLDGTRDAATLRVLALTLLGSVLLGTLIVAGSGRMLVRRALAPIATLATEMRHIAPHRAAPALDPAAYDAELRPWIAQFNELLTRARSGYAEIEAFSANVAHEMRTPLANLVAATEVALMHATRGGAQGAARAGIDTDVEALLGSNLEELQRLSAIVADMLFLARADQGERPARLQALDLADEARAVADYHEAALDAAGLRAVVMGQAPALADAALLRRAIANLLANAMRHAAPGSTITLVASHTPGEARIGVRNPGSPLAPEVLPRLFERFYRADAAREGSATRHGLGLAIVQAIAHMHGGNGFATHADGHTTIGFSVQMPAPPLPPLRY